ncbi:large ATP-binding protein [Streptomyces sp. NPDC046985]|uniref:large ATP-binding protein n=1 Tax=Streptomyces sp. NPDC046985 TaxID=3155377 RepID=UPI0033EF7F96
MNPFDADTHPGPYLVVEVLGVGDVSVPALAPGPEEPLHQAATRVIEAAAALDKRHESVLGAVQRAQRLLEGIGRGEVGRAQVSYALLRTALPEVGDALAQQDRAYSQLVESLSAYRHLLTESNSSQVTPVKTHELDDDHGAGRDDDWAVSGDRSLGALEAVEAGELRVRQSAIYGYIYLSDGTGQRPDPEVWPETVQRLVADGLLAQDTSEELYRPGQLLSLTPQGERALRDIRTATPRVSAALSRSGVAAIFGSDVGPSPAPATNPTAKSLRSR